MPTLRLLFALTVLLGAGCRDAPSSGTAPALPPPSSDGTAGPQQNPLPDPPDRLDPAGQNATDPDFGESLPPPAPPSTGEGADASCDLRAANGYCYAFSGSGWTDERASAECGGAATATFAPTACPTADRIGTCTYRPGGDAARELVYTYYAPMDPQLARLSCPGTFTAM